ncbi:MAG: serine hydrolase [Candidatus Xenobiia bacterium LiM19]
MYINVHKAKHRKMLLLVLIAAFFTSIVINSPSEAQSPESTLLKSHIEKTIKGINGEVGVAIKHLESGEEILINQDKLFPMASTFKTAVMVEVFHQIIEGRLKLDEEIIITTSDIHIGGTILNDLHIPGVTLSIRNLLTLMMTVSENSATDILLAKIGIENVNRRMKAMGLEDIYINRNCQQIILDYFGMNDERYKNLSQTELRGVIASYDKNSLSAIEACAGFHRDMRDVSSPLCMNRLMENILTAKILDVSTCNKMLELMLKCRTGENRLRGMLPPGVAVAHKTGTLVTTVNDTGIIFLPENRGHIIITVFSRMIKDPEQKMEKVIAEIARSSYDYFYYLKK